MRSIILAVLFLFATAAFAEEWIEYQPPMMDDVTVDPLRFTQQGTPFDLSDPMFVPSVHDQSSKGTRSNNTTKDNLVIDCEFTGKAGLEYLEIKTKIKIDKPGFNLGGKFKTDLQKMGVVRMRINDPSGETHQHTLGNPNGEPIYAKVETSPDGIWGGDGDKKLQFPCEIVAFILDKPEPGFKGKGQFEIANLALYEAVELRDAMKIEFAADSPPGLLFESKGTLKLRLTPKNLKEGETLFFRFPDVREPEAYISPRGMGAYQPIGFLRMNQVKVDGTPFFDITHISGNEMIKDDRGEVFSRPVTYTEVPAKGMILELPVTVPGAARIVLTPFIWHESERTVNLPAVPVAFSYGYIAPNTPKDDRLGICTHYQQGWNTNSLDFVKKAGLGMIRDEMTWGNVEREKGKLALPNYASYVDKVIDKTLQPLLVLNYSNRFYDDNGFPVSDEAVASFANYSRFLAGQFKGRVKYFEVWNEWTGGCGMGHATSRKTNTPENYVKMLKATFEAVKAANPEAYIIGGGGDHSGHQLKQIEEMFEAGALKYCDAFSIHPYRQPRTPEESGLVDEVVNVAELMKKHSVKEPKLWLTEIGWPTPKKHPAKDAELFQAAMVVRSIVPLLASGVVEKYFWYDLKNDGLDRIDQEHNFGIIRNDRLGLQVKPAFIAFAVMSNNTAGRTITKEEELSKEGVHAYRLTKPGEADRLVLWAANGRKVIKITGIQSAATLLGTPCRFDDQGTIILTEEPIWITLK